jgi:hypothetical protein
MRPPAPYLSWASVDTGHTIQVEVLLDDESRAAFRFGFEHAAKLSQAIIQAAAIAEKLQRAMPNNELQLVSPWLATGIRAGRSADGAGLQP